ncbi:MAG: exopolyphosphatase [Bacteroidetes bacterium HGW-Bacteroidetes-4]|jgi:exopolyphosphatase/guanosine-5'-triphosphate,3'-diphosphate pyrophosphatase|nr:MAG: exopolyphosphatase [Bacteroidetes bacterium HGW-Bacteroidetes-4]
MIFASVDIGSNAGRLLVATVHEFNKKPISEKITLVRVPLRLGIDVFEKGYITPERQDLLIRTFEAYYQLLNVYKPIDFYAVATSALREASNRVEVLNRIKNETGFILHLIEGRREAEIISNSGNTNLIKEHPHSLFIDVGGGSTEISWYVNDVLISTKSFDVGTIRLLFDKVERSEWESLKHWLAEIKLEQQPFNCICSGGNINKLTKLFGNRNKNTLSYSQLTEGHELLEGYSVEDRVEKMGLRIDRADVIVPAAIIFKKIMSWGKIQELQAPKIGLADGVIIELYKRHKGLPSILSE